MALKFIDGFDHYATADLTLKWNSIGVSTAIDATGGRRGSGALALDAGSSKYVQKTIAAVATAVVGFALKYTGTPSQGYLVYFGDAGADQCGFRFNADGTVSFYRGTTLVATSSNSMSAGTWYYCEAKVLINNTTGTYEFRVNGTSTGWLAATGQNTRSTANNTTNGIYFNARAANQSSQGINSTTVRIDDFYYLDTSGSAPNNDFLGDVRIDTVLPSGAGNTTQFTPSTGSNYQCVDEASQNGDTDYVQDSTVNHKDTYAYADITHTPSAIYGVQVNMIAKKDDAGTRSVCSVVRSGGTDTDGATQALSAVSYSDLMEIIENDPNTAAAWTKTNLNAAEFGVKLVA